MGSSQDASPTEAGQVAPADELRLIVGAILADARHVIEIAALGEATGIDKDRIEGRLEHLESQGKIKKLGRTSSGAYIQITQGNRLSLEELFPLDKSDPVLRPNPQNQGIGEASEESDAPEETLNPIDKTKIVVAIVSEKGNSTNEAVLARKTGLDANTCLLYTSPSPRDRG